MILLAVAFKGFIWQVSYAEKISLAALMFSFYKIHICSVCFFYLLYITYYSQSQVEEFILCWCYNRLLEVPRLRFLFCVWFVTFINRAYRTYRAYETLPCGISVRWQESFTFKWYVKQIKQSSSRSLFLHLTGVLVDLRSSFWCHAITVQLIVFINLWMSLFWDVLYFLFQNLASTPTPPSSPFFIVI